MKLFVFALYVLSSSAFANVDFCTAELKMKTLQNHVNIELGTDYEIAEASKSLVSEKFGVLASSTEGDFLLAEGYVGECSGGSVWGMLGIKTSHKLLASGLCEVVDTQSGGVCED
ncbi:MAG: hypothetical protein H7328_06730 [Bdellovibrio sp.]|nr:hypothetical protein [Bdellovibrio sp.]